MIKLYKINSFLLGIGFIHTALTPVFYKSLTLDALWFAGAGLAFALLGVINFIASRIPQKWILNICIVSNLIMLIYGLLITILLKEPQAFISVIILITITILSFIVRYRLNSEVELK